LEDFPICDILMAAIVQSKGAAIKKLSMKDIIIRSNIKGSRTPALSLALLFERGAMKNQKPGIKNFSIWVHKGNDLLYLIHHTKKSIIVRVMKDN